MNIDNDKVKKAVVWINNIPTGCKWNENIETFNCLAELFLAGKIGGIKSKEEIEKEVGNENKNKMQRKKLQKMSFQK